MERLNSQENRWIEGRCYRTVRSNSPLYADIAEGYRNSLKPDMKHPLDHYGRIEIRRRFQLPPVRTTFIEIRELTERRANEQDEAADYRPAERRLHRSRRSREPMAKLPLPFRKTVGRCLRKTKKTTLIFRRKCHNLEALPF
ncbi:hypothetical protein HZH68_013850 [Vespula germanica]|uniref:Uncharacterized protein n=1 Tax=Vespula germanica TaxID=30212 RepID=A0A834JCC6_VESGE|nr:hypothetical protein HZH68_013850 [Vespula germanica]